MAKKKDKGLSDAELIEKYGHLGPVNFEKILKLTLEPSKENKYMGKDFHENSHKFYALVENEYPNISEELDIIFNENPVRLKFRKPDKLSKEIKDHCQAIFQILFYPEN